MGRRSAEGAGTARIAVVGATTTAGASLREALARRRTPGSRVDLYGTQPGEALVGEYAGEARLIQEPELSELRRHDVAFVCEPIAATETLREEDFPETLLIDMISSGPAEARTQLVHMEVNPPRATDSAGGVLAVPHELTALLIDLLHPLEREFGLAEVLAWITRPAADFGDMGVEELRTQTVHLLNFGEIPREVFGRQLAFNVIPQSCIGPDRALENRLTVEVGELLGWGERRIAVSLAAVPVFYGHGIQLRVRCSEPTSLPSMSSALAELRRGTHGKNGDGPRTPLDVSAQRTTAVVDISEDGLGGFWIWAVAGEAQANRAELAVRLAAALRDL